MKKTKEFSWSNKDTKTVKKIINKITNHLTLSFPDFNSEFQLYTDASDQAIGGMLKQKDKVIAIYSHKLNDSQQKYTTTEKEMLAVIECLKNFKNIIFSAKISVYVDHANLLFEGDINNSRVHRWKIILNEFNLELKYIKGENNSAADCLSRPLLIQSEFPNYRYNFKEIYTHQNQSNLKLNKTKYLPYNL